MPTYDYECDACGHAFEEWQSFKDNPLTKCPQCKKKKLRRLFGGGAAIIFKGSGFYETDYRRAETELSRVSGDLLAARGIEVEAASSTNSTTTEVQHDVPQGGTR